MKLYYNPGVCSLAPHIVFREAGLDVTLVKVDDATKKTEDGSDYLTVNPNGYVPALEIGPGTVLTEGPAIMQYLADLAPASGLAPANGTPARYQFQAWLNFITSEIHKTYGALFKPLPPEAKTVFKELLAKRFDFVERHLARHDYLQDRFSAADAYLYVTTSWSPYVGVDMEKWPALRAFRARVAARPAVKAALQAEGLLK